LSFATAFDGESASKTLRSPGNRLQPAERAPDPAQPLELSAVVGRSTTRAPPPRRPRRRDRRDRSRDTRSPRSRNRTAAAPTLRRPLARERSAAEAAEDDRRRGFGEHGGQVGPSRFERVASLDELSTTAVSSPDNAGLPAFRPAPPEPTAAARCSGSGRGRAAHSPAAAPARLRALGPSRRPPSADDPAVRSRRARRRRPRGTTRTGLHPPPSPQPASPRWADGRARRGRRAPRSRSKIAPPLGDDRLTLRPGAEETHHR
jgi:hypothetical protein